MTNEDKNAAVHSELMAVLTRHGLAPAERLIAAVKLVRDEATKTGMTAQQMLVQAAAVLSGRGL